MSDFILQTQRWQLLLFKASTTLHNLAKKEDCMQGTRLNLFSRNPEFLQGGGAVPSMLILLDFSLETLFIKCNSAKETFLYREGWRRKLGLSPFWHADIFKLWSLSRYSTFGSGRRAENMLRAHPVGRKNCPTRWILDTRRLKWDP